MDQEITHLIRSIMVLSMIMVCLKHILMSIYLPPSFSLKFFVTYVCFHVIVFDVDIGDGEPIRKLPYNRGGSYCYLVPHHIVYSCIRYPILWKFHGDVQNSYSFTAYNFGRCMLFADNPYDTADKWLLKENLPLVYRQQVVEFILQNCGQKDFSLDPSFRDPYTGCMY